MSADQGSSPRRKCATVNVFQRKRMCLQTRYGHQFPPRSGRALGASRHGVKRSWQGALIMPPASRNTETLTRNKTSFFSPSSLGNQEPFPLGALHRVKEKNLYSVWGRDAWGRLRTRCHQTRGLGSGRASSSSRTYCPACWGRACMGTWRGRAAGASGGS